MSTLAADLDPLAPPPEAPRLRRPALSIRSTVMLAIVAGMVLPALALLAVDQSLTRRSHELLVQRTRAAVVTTAVAAVTQPAWSLDQAALRQTVERIRREPAVCSVRVLDLQPDSTMDKPQPVSSGECPDNGRSVSVESPVKHEGQTVARLRVGFDGTEVDQHLAERRRLMAALVAVQVLVGVLVLAGVLSSRLLRPIDRLKAQAGQLAAREPMPAHDWPHGDELGELGQHLNTVHGQIRDLIAELEGKNEQLHRMAMFDHLTGLPNRTLLREMFTREAALARRSGMTLALLFIDLDHFKSVNDRFGHAAGDELLVRPRPAASATRCASPTCCAASVATNSWP
jgi:predicted signal transduction protein with EAL and GGDEF domain